MTDTKLSHPHDHFMKELLSYPETAGTLLRERLPDAVVKFLSAKPPELIPGSFVDQELRGHLSDRLFEVETSTGKTAFLIQVYCYDEQTLRRIIHEVRPEEEETMMSQFAQDIREKALQEGMQQGIRKGLLEGEAKGEVKGEAKLLLRMLPRRFGPLPDEIYERVYKADPNTIELWADRVLDAESLEDVFSDYTATRHNSSF